MGCRHLEPYVALAYSLVMPVTMLDTLLQDVKYAARSLRRTPGFTTAAVITLALGMGANATIFTLLDAVLFKPLPVSRPDELLTVYENSPDAAPDALPDTAGGTGRYLRFSYPRFRRLQEALGENGSIAASTLSALYVGRTPGSPNATRILTQLVSGEYFSMLGIAMQRGRPLSNADMQRDERGGVAVISDRFWRTAFSRSEQIIGQTIDIKGVALTVVGVAAPEFIGIRTDTVADLWVPLTLQDSIGYTYNSTTYGGSDLRKPWMDQDTVSWLVLSARVDPAKRAQATAILETANARGVQHLAETLENPAERSAVLARSLVVRSFAQGFSGLRTRFSDALFALAAMVVVVLLVTCANISNLLLARATGRSRETGIRLALGASTGRLVRQYLAESLLLSTAGGAMSILAAYWTSTILARAVFGRAGELPPVFTLDARVWLFTAALATGSALAFGLAPALRAVGAGLAHGININQRVSTYTAMRGMRPLVATQLALSFAVVFGAVLLGRTLSHYARIDPGFNADRVVTAAINPDSSGYTREQGPALVDRLVAGINGVPGVVSTAVSTCGLITNCSYGSAFTIEGAGGGISLNNNWVSPTYFSTAGIPLVAGRDFTERDTAQAPRVAIISESVARRFFPNQNPLGKRIERQAGRTPADETALNTEIVGVVRDVRPTLHADPGPMLYFPTKQPPVFTALPHAIVVRTSGDADAAVAVVRAAIQRTEPGLLVDTVTTMAAAIGRDVARERLVAYLAASFAGLALLLACVGLYGVLSYTVARRTQEIGVRVALGAQPSDLIRMVIGDGSRVVLVGIAAGVGAAIVVGRLVTTLLAGVSASDPMTLIAVGAALAVVTLAASYLPARRASRIEPVTALRTE
jgi:predicted permease